MTPITTLVGKATSFFMCLALTLTLTTQAFAAVAPNLKSAATYGALTGAGAIENTGLTIITGDIGTNVGAVTGFPPGVYSGEKHVADAQTIAAKNDLVAAYNSLNDATNRIIYDTAIGATMGNGQVLTPRTYRRADLTTIGGDLTFDAQGNPNALFILKLAGALNVAANTRILLVNGAKANNIYWAVDGPVSVLDNTLFKGNILADGAIHLYNGARLDGRALTVAGALTFATNTITVPTAAAGDTLVVITPAAGDTVRSGTQNYRIAWIGNRIAPMKTFEYSLDSGRTWTTIGTMTTTGNTYEWDVPDTVSNKALVRVTDANNLRGVSGLFTISRTFTPGTVVVVRPAAGEIIEGGTQDYAITWTSVGMKPQKSFELSLDSGMTWTFFGIDNSNATTYAWDVPDTASTRAIIRITDISGATGKSGVFTITKSVTPIANITVLRPTAGEIIQGGYQNYLISYTATNTTQQKTFEYSLDSGATWSMIGVSTTSDQFYVWPSVPNVATTNALVRITDSNGVRGLSGLFTITTSPSDGSIDNLTLSGLDENRNIGNNRVLGISWTYTGDIGTSVDVEYTLNYGITWDLIATVPATAAQNATWTTPMNGYYNPVVIRVTSTKGIVRASAPFTIGSPTASVEVDAPTNGYSVSNHPNPTTDNTTISFVLPTASTVALTIIDNRGSAIGTIVSQQFDAGTHAVQFNTSALATGMYTYILQAGSTRVAGRMSVVK